MKRFNVHSLYARNNLLSLAFALLLTLTLFIALFLGYKFMNEFVESKFYADKSEVLDNTVRSYNEFVYDKVREISLYRGFLDSTHIENVINANFSEYPFIKKVYFYDLAITNSILGDFDGVRVDSLMIGTKEIFEFERTGGQRFKMQKLDKKTDYFTQVNNDMVNAVIKLTNYVQIADTTKDLSPEDYFKIFYTIDDSRLSYLSTLSREDIAAYKQLMFDPYLPTIRYDQDLLLFELDPYQLPINNVDPGLYEHISIRPVIFDSLSNSSSHKVTDIVLPGSFSAYKLYFISSDRHLVTRALMIFRPIALMVVIVYGLLILMSYLLFRNMKMNQHMFKLQYDFINNLTHEFKTPVSVVKIAGNNIRNSDGLTDRERKHYGKILDEEADKLNDLMTKLLSFTQIESKSIRLKKEKINLDVFCQNLVDEYQIKYPKFTIDFTISGLQHMVGDKVLLGSVFANMVDNAYKYSPPDRRYLFIDIRKLRKNLVVRFIDHGIGIKKTELENVFKRFYKVENEFNRHGSVGIGLAFCKEVINYMDGSISVKSEIGKGSEFIIILPLGDKH